MRQFALPLRNAHYCLRMATRKIGLPMNIFLKLPLTSSISMSSTKWILLATQSSYKKFQIWRGIMEDWLYSIPEKEVMFRWRLSCLNLPSRNSWKPTFKTTKNYPSITWPTAKSKCTLVLQAKQWNKVIVYDSYVYLLCNITMGNLSILIIIKY